MSRFAIVDAFNTVVGVALSTVSLESPGERWVLLTPVEAQTVGIGWTWVGGIFSPPVVAPEMPRPKTIRIASLMQRMTLNEEIAFDLARQFDATQNNVQQKAAAKWRVRYKHLYDLSSVRLNKPVVANFFNDLEAAGVLAAGRAAEILAAPITDAEEAGN